jgi:tetratricopeptide (TPR) repeat protein
MDAGLPYVTGAHSGLPYDLEYSRFSSATLRVLRLLPLHPGPDMSAAAVAALTDLSVGEARDAAECLVQARLIENSPESQERWRFHSPVPSYIQRLSGDSSAQEREKAQDRLLDYYLIAAEAADRQVRSLPPLSASEKFADRSEALAWLDSERSCLLAVVRMAAETGKYDGAKRLPLLMAHYLGFRGLFDDLLAVTTTSLRSARLLDDRIAEGEALTNLGLASWGLRHYHDAVIAHRDAVALFRESGDRQGEGDALNNLGIALHGLGQDNEAAGVHQNAAAIFRDISDLFNEGKALNNLGIALCAMRKFGDAMKSHQGAVAIFRETGREYEEASSLANLGNDFRKLGLLDQAIAAYQKAADIFHETGDHRNELMVLQSLQMNSQA